jgi:hypothetical protein
MTKFFLGNFKIHKQFAFFSVFLLLFTNGIAQVDFMWPVLGKEMGENILFRPNDRIVDEINNSDIIIFTDENSSIVSPVTGQITSFNYTYRIKYSSLIWFGVPPSSNYSADCNEILKNNRDKNYDPKYISATVGIKIPDGRIIYISGIKPESIFHTGEKILQGEKIGKAGYLYYKITKPCIALSISKNGQGEDPMLPLGLKSTFKKFEKKEITNLNKTDALEDVNVLVVALEEGYPGLYDYISSEKWEQLILNIKNQLSENISLYDFYTLLETSIINQIKDNHFVIISRQPKKRKEESSCLPKIAFGFLNDSLIVTRAILTYDEYLGKSIKEVNGIPADSIKQLVKNRINNIDGFTQSGIDYNLLVWTWYFFDRVSDNQNSEYAVKFSNDSTVFFHQKKSINKNVCVPWNANWSNFFFHNTDSLTFSKIDDSVAYIAIHSFFLTEVEMDKISTFVKQLQDSSYKHIIIDLRNNSGGDDRICAKLFSFFAQQPFLMQEYSQVKKKNDFKFFRFCTNYNEDVSDLFMEYSMLDSKEGYFIINHDTIYPDPNINFKGNLYLITNERSLSAATIFAGLVHKYRRGIIIGRETGNTYHQMNATKFAQLLLPNSQIEISIPLVKNVFDMEKSKIPYGRGVIPHYVIDFSLDELESIHGDTMLNYAFQCIYDGKYLIDEEIVSSSEKKSNFILISCIAIIIGVSFVIIIIIIIFLLKFPKKLIFNFLSHSK